MNDGHQNVLTCECGINKFSVKGKPLLRAICHCQFCQDFNKSEYGDFLIYRKEQVIFIDQSKSTYKSYKKPPIVKRGSCKQCGKPVLEYLQAPLFPKLVFIPAENHSQQEPLLQPSLHMFYHRRIRDAEDQIPKYSGYLLSEMNFMGRLISKLYLHDGK